MFTESGGGKNGGLSLKYVEKHVDKWKSQRKEPVEKLVENVNNAK